MAILFPSTCVFELYYISLQEECIKTVISYSKIDSAIKVVSLIELYNAKPIIIQSL